MSDKVTTAVKRGTIIATCRCVHAYQDAVYGHSKRVHNVGKKLRCTVCGATR